MARLLVYTPTYMGRMEKAMMQSVETQQFEGEVDWVISDNNPYPGRDMRNVCHQFIAGRQLALDGGYDAMLTVEHDMLLPDGAIQTLYDTPAPVVYAIYMLRHGTAVVNLFQKCGERNLGMSLSLHRRDLKAARKARMIEVSGSGNGCTLIRRHVLERIPFQMNDHPPDIPFATDCLRAGIKQVGRLDVACGHIDAERGIVLTPFENYGADVKVLALRTMAVGVVDDSLAIVEGKHYSMPLNVALDHERAGYVRIEGQVDREVATAPPAAETADVKKIKPKRRRAPRRKTANAAGDSN